MPYKTLPKRFRGRCHDPARETVPGRSPGHGSDGSYEPPCEVVQLKARQRVRQVRRISALLKAVKNYDGAIIPVARLRDLLLEWNCICRAPGYGVSWYKWILAFEAVQSVPMGLPTADELDIFMTVT